MAQHKQWELDAEYGSDILGTGQAWGDMRGKVKTKQIGFVRSDGRSKGPKDVPRKSGVSNKGRSKAG